MKIKSKDGIKEQKVPVKISRHGPIISDIMSYMPANCAMMWPGLLGHDGTVEGLLTMNRATNFDEFRKALSVVRGASRTHGICRHRRQYRIPVHDHFPDQKIRRQSLCPCPERTALMIGPATSRLRTIPFDYNPAKGYLASFNQMPKPGDYYGTAYFLFERPYRFEDIVKSKDKFSPEDVSKDAAGYGFPCGRTMGAANIHESVAALPGYQPMPICLKNWDCSASLDSPEATLFNSFFTHLITNTFENKLGSKIMDRIIWRPPRDHTQRSG